MSLLWFLIGLLVGALLTWLFVALPLQRKLRSRAGGPAVDAKAPADTAAGEPAPAESQPEPAAVAALASTNGSSPKAATNGSATKNAAAKKAATNGAATNGAAAKTTSAAAKPRAAATRAPKKADSPASKNGSASTRKKSETTSPATSNAEKAEPAATAVATIEPGPYPRSARPAADGSTPSPEFTIKGNAGSKLYHTPSSPYYGRTKAEAWFATAEDAEAAGFTAWRRK